MFTFYVYSHNKIHQAKLDQIAHSGQPLKAPVIFKSNQARDVQEGIRKYRAEKKKTAIFNEAEKNAAISYENNILLSKLVDISNGKWSAVPVPMQRRRTTQTPNRSSRQ